MRTPRFELISRKYSLADTEDTWHTEFRAMGKTYKSLEDITNYFIETAQKGKALAPCSDEMKALVAYLKSLKPAK